MRINGKPGVRMQVNKQSGKNTVDVSAALKREVERINQRGPGRAAVGDSDDTAVFIERSIAAVQEARAPRLVPGRAASSSRSCATSARR